MKFLKYALLISMSMTCFVSSSFAMNIKDTYVVSIEKRADQGDADSQYNLGFMYFYGLGVVKNYSKAIKWYQKAADQGNARAKHDLEGGIYIK